MHCLYGSRIHEAAQLRKYLDEMHEKQMKLQGQLPQQAAGPSMNVATIVGSSARVSFRGKPEKEVENFKTNVNLQVIFIVFDDKRQGLVKEAARWHARRPLVP